MARILVINPNSSADVTAQILDSALRAPLSPGTCVMGATNDRGPPGIETDAHVAEVAEHLKTMVAAEVAHAYVIACFSDPAVDSLRGVLKQPVIGIGEAGYLAALGLGARFGVISVVDASISRHRARLEGLGFDGRLAGDRAINIGVAGLAGPEVASRLLEVGRALKSDGADSLILGCAGLGGYRAELQKALQLPVIDPVATAVAQAQTILSLGLHRPF